MRILAIVAAIGFLSAESSAEGTGAVHPVAGADSSAAAVIALTQNDSTAVVVSTPSPLCTLDIATEPPGAAVTIDGRQTGVSPLIIAGIAAGKHTIILQKPGFYQKKAVVDIPVAGRTPLSFQLSAPGSLSIVSEPAGAAVTINGKERGVTPYKDSPVRPGTYIVSIRKEHYNVIDDTMVVASGGTTLYKGVLHFSSAYSDSLKQSAQTERVRKKRISISLVAGAFTLFLLTLAIIESKE